MRRFYRLIAIFITLAGGAAPGTAQLHHFAVEAQAGGPIVSRTTRTPFFIQVLAQDSMNTTQTSFTGTVEITSNGPLIAGGGTSVSFTSGILSSHSVNFDSGGYFIIQVANSAGVESGASDTFTISNPLPQITALSPSSRTAGDTGFTIIVTGSGFTPVSSVLFDGLAGTTTFVSDSQVTAFIAAVRIDTAGSFAVAAFSPAPGGGSSGPAVFTVLDPVLRAKVFLEGPYSGGGSMSTQLRTDGVIPLAHPFTGPPWNYPGPENVAAIPADVVDWILLGLRTGTTGPTQVSRRAAFLRSDGTIVDLNGSDPVAFSGIGLGRYFVVVRPRNHLPAMTAAARPLNAPVDSCDFTTGPVKYFGGSPKSLEGGAWGLFSGDYSGDGFIDASDFAGPDNDIFQSGYLRSDLNLDGFIDASDFLYPDNNIFTGSNVPN
jgi:hypothetical protein